MLVPVPSLDRHVVTSSEYNARSGMDRQASNVIWMRFERSNLLVRVVVEDPKLEVIRARDKPVLARDEAAASYWDFRYFKRFYEPAGLVVVDVNGAIIEASK